MIFSQLDGTTCIQIHSLVFDYNYSLFSFESHLDMKLHIHDRESIFSL